MESYLNDEKEYFDRIVIYDDDSDQRELRDSQDKVVDHEALFLYSADRNNHIVFLVLIVHNILLQCLKLNLIYDDY